MDQCSNKKSLLDIFCWGELGILEIFNVALQRNLVAGDVSAGGSSQRLAGSGHYLGVGGTWCWVMGNSPLAVMVSPHSR